MLRVAIAEDHAPTRERLALFLERSGRARVVLAAPDGPALLAGLSALPSGDRPDVVVMDVEMPGPTGIETTARLTAAHPGVEVLVFTVFEDDERLFAAIEAGASGYLLKDQPLPEILAALEELAAGGAPMAPPLARRLLERVRRPADPLPLTTREVEVLRAVAEGLTNAEIAARLFVSPTTVKTHVRNLYEKLHVSTRAGATRAAVRAGLLG